MRKGFLLTADNKEKKRRAQSRNVKDSNHPSPLRDRKDDKMHDETTSRTHAGAGLSMKQGFLLQSSSITTRRKCNQQERLSGRKSSDDQDTTKATPLPQSIANKKRVVTAASAALLDLEESTVKIDPIGAPPNDDIVSSPSLINFTSSSVESTCSHNDYRDDEASDCKRPPIIVETVDRPITVIAEKIMDDVGSAEPANDNNVCREENAVTSNDTAANEMESFAFASEVSQLLSRLRRALKSNNKSKRKDETNDSLIGVRQFMNQKSEQLIKAFVETHMLCLDASVENKLRLRQLWTLILHEIAQESPTSSLKKTKKKSTYAVSCQLALGLGVLEFSKPIGVALESVADVLSNLASSIIQPITDKEKQKRYKTEAIGAILLLRYHFRCMSIEASEEQTVVNETNRLKRIEIETSMLLKKVIPALQSVVMNGQKRTYLSSTAADAFFKLIEIFPRIQSSGFCSSIASSHSIWEDILPRIEEMINVKRLWVTKNEDDASSEIRATPTLFCNAPCQVILPSVLDYLSHRYPSPTSISCILCNVMEANAKERANEFVGCLILSAQRLENCKLIFEDNGGSWKSLLLESDEECAYKNILLAAAKAMVDMPSSTIPLSLFSCLVGTTNACDVTDSELKILLATVSVVRFAVDELRLSREIDTEVFKRFSPLLILRRLPKVYYQILHKHTLSDAVSSRTVLCEALANGFRAHALKNDEGNLAREEKVLMAQVAGHCLPFSATPNVNESPISLFDLCKKPFSATLDNMRTKSKTSLGLQNMHESKLALFAVCQHIPGANDEDISGNALINVASFVIHFLLESQTTRGDDIEHELAKLHTGCLHFLGVVFDSLFARKAKISAEPQIELEANSSHTFLDGLMKTFDMTTSIVFNGAIEGHSEQRVSASMRTSIFNAMVIYSQSCTTEDHRLALFASELLPALLKWVDEGAIDDDIRHPLCVAAALQVFYTILAKLASFDWVSTLCNESELNFVRLTMRCALKSLCSEEGAGIISPLRLAAMKVLLTVIANKQNLGEYLQPDEIRHAVVAVRGASNRDESQEVRTLAFEILPYLEHVIDS
ncbi:hypothetical protein QTG54_016416 [Skeletonema marinoi]|uniref:Uncharacterized protein n=1 Tax=Skeletonema marinoi TaxID=267567 RepID=A0AAD8XSL7_9STRA|nr:hypothetical protein QTG54_016416 [Skeletonema marinoi]